MRKVKSLVAVAVLLAVFLASGNVRAAQNNSAAQTVEIFSAGEKFGSMSAYRQHQLKQVHVVEELNAIEEKASLEQQPKDVILGAGSISDLAQLQNMLEAYRQDNKEFSEDFKLDPAKMKTIAISPTQISSSAFKPKQIVLPLSSIEKQQVHAFIKAQKIREILEESTLQQLKAKKAEPSQAQHDSSSALSSSVGHDAPN